MHSVAEFVQWVVGSEAPVRAALLTALVGGTVAFVVALVNAIAARRLERAAAHRAYRVQTTRPAVDYARAANLEMIRIRQVLFPFSALDFSGKVPGDLAEGLRRLYENQDVFVTDPLLNMAVVSLNDAIAKFVFSVEADGSSIHSEVTSYFDATWSAAVAVELAAEAYVYGGLSVKIRAHKVTAGVRAQLAKL